jgi:RNA polymerase sigma factor
VEAFRPFVREVASACCRRPLHWGNDDELSVALLALDEAITTFREDAGRQFPNHARQVIAHRLIDFFRKQSRHQHLSLDAMLQASEQETSTALEATRSWDLFRAQEERRQRQAEIVEYSRILGTYGLSLTVLKEHCPKHKDTRQQLVQIARSFARHPHLAEALQRTKQLPLKEVELLTGASRKVLDTHRRYLIALVLLIIHSDLETLRSFAGVGAKGGGEP